MKQFSRILCALLALLLTASCAFAETTDTTDTSGWLAIVNGKPVDITDARAEYEYYSMIYTLYGYGEADLAQLRHEIADSYIQMELIYQQFDALGLGKDVDMELLKSEAKAAFESNVESYKVYVQKEGKTEEQIEQETRALMESDGYGIDYFERTAYNQVRIQAVTDYYAQSMNVSEEDVRAYYDEMVQSDKEYYEANPAAYEDAISYGEPVMYVPEGFRAVKHILIKLSDEDVDRMYKLEQDLEAVKLSYSKSNANIADLKERQAAIEAEMDEIFATIDGRAQEVMDKLTAGGDFIELMNEYGEDPGMTYEPHMTDGYILFADSRSWVTPFRDGAMALEKPGDISHPIRTYYGLHIIRYEYDVVSGATPYEDVKDALRDELAAELLNEHYANLLNQWYTDADIELYLDNLMS